MSVRLGYITRKFVEGQKKCIAQGLAAIMASGRLPVRPVGVQNYTRNLKANTGVGVMNASKSIAGNIEKTGVKSIFGVLAVGLRAMFLLTILIWSKRVGFVRAVVLLVVGRHDPGKPILRFAGYVGQDLQLINQSASCAQLAAVVDGATGDHIVSGMG